MKYYAPSSSESNFGVGSAIEVMPESFRYIANKICTNTECRYPLLALRILIYVVTSADSQGRIYISARHLSKALGAHYDTTTKCIKYLRKIEVLTRDN